MAYSVSSASRGSLSDFVASNTASIHQEWEAIQPLLKSHPEGQKVMNGINVQIKTGFKDVAEPIAQALAQYKLFPDLDEFVDTLKLCVSEPTVSAGSTTTESPKVVSTEAEKLWQIPTFDEDIRMMNRKPSLLAFQKRVDSAFSMIGRPSVQEIEQKTSAKLAVPSVTLFSGGYETLSASATIDRTSRLEEARKTMFAKRTVASAGVPPSVQSFTPYQSSFGENMAHSSSNSQPEFKMPRMSLIQMRDFLKQIQTAAPERFGRFLEIVEGVKDRHVALNVHGKALLQLFEDQPTIKETITTFLPASLATEDVFADRSRPGQSRLVAIRQRITLARLGRFGRKMQNGSNVGDDDDVDDDEGNETGGAGNTQKSSTPSGQMYSKITIVTLTGKHIILNGCVGPLSTALDLKNAVAAREGIPAEMQRLIFAGRQLEDHNVLSAFFIQDGATLHLVLRLRGPSKTPVSASAFAAPATSGHSKVPAYLLEQKKKAAPKKKRVADSDGDSDDGEMTKKVPPSKKAPNTFSAKKAALKKKRAADSDDDDSDDGEIVKKVAARKMGKKVAKKMDATPTKKSKKAGSVRAVKKAAQKAPWATASGSDSGSSSNSDSDSDSEEVPKKKQKVKKVHRTKLAASSSSFGFSRAPSARASSQPSKSIPTISEHWEKHGTVWIRGSKARKGFGMVAAFDMDQTLISVKSGAKFPKDHTDWQWMCDAVVPKIQALRQQGFRIAIITNQNGIETGQQRAADILTKIDTIAEKLGETEDNPIVALVATSKDKYRKPSPILWDLFIEKLNMGMIPGAQTFYVGDAAGRPKRDHSCADRSFAHNAGIPFLTEDAFFLGAPSDAINAVPFPEDPIVTEFKKTAKTGYAQPHSINAASGPIELVLMCGMPGSGKSTIYKTIFEPRGYTHVNLDTIRNPAKCLELTTNALKQGTSVVVDQTFANPEKRGPYTQVAKTLNVPVRIVCLDTPMPIAIHLNTIRNWIYEQPFVPTIAYHVYLKGYVAPTLEEGFEAIIKLPFQFNATDPKLITAIQWHTN